MDALVTEEGPGKIRSICTTLREKYGNLQDLGNKQDPLDELIFILLTVRTDYRQYVPLWNNFTNHFRNWNEVLHSREEEVSVAIISGGLQRQKAQRIRESLAAIERLTGDLDLDFLRYFTDEEAEKFLLSLPGVGKKVAKCVMMYSLHRPVLPIDSNIIRVWGRIGLDGNNTTERMILNSLESKIPEGERYSFHTGLVGLGREICLRTKPKCGICPIVEYCVYGRSVVS